MTNSRSILIDLQEKLHSINPNLPINFPPDDNFKEKWNLDSLDLVEFVARIEHHYQISIPDLDFEKFTSLNKIIGYLTEKNHAG